MGVSILLAPLVASLAAKAEDERRLNAAAMAVEKRALRNLPEALGEVDLNGRASPSTLFLRRTEASTGFFEIRAGDMTPFASGTMVAGPDTALDYDTPEDALARLSEWLRRHDALTGQ